MGIKENSIKNQGFKYQIGFYTESNYKRLAVRKNKINEKAMISIAKKNNVPVSKLVVQVIQ